MARYIKSFANDAAIQAAVDDKSLGKPYVALNESAGTIDWNGKDIDYSSMYFTIEALEDGNLTVKRNCDYSINGGEWVSVSGSKAISVNNGDAVRFRGSTKQAIEMFTDNTVKFIVYGNILSLGYGDDFSGLTTGFSVSKMFSGCTGVIDASDLILPQTSLSESHGYMFNGCTNLVKGPVLPAKTLSSMAYNNLFKNCSKLNYIKCLATNISASLCLQRWVQGVSPTGTFVKKAGVSWPTGDSGIPSGWTVIEE